MRVQIRSAEHAVVLYIDSIDRTTATRSIDPGERVLRPKVLACPKCACRTWEFSKSGYWIVCGGKKCHQRWPSEYVSSGPVARPVGHPPCELSMEMRIDLAMVFSTKRLGRYEPHPLSPWQLYVLMHHVALGREATPGGRMAALAAQMQERYPASPYAPWSRTAVRRLLRGAEQQVEKRLRYKRMMT
jgi:hypothetical protein